MDIVRTRESLAAAIRALRSQGKSIALVPTMGALHEGHMALVAAAKTQCDAVVVSIFVNPTQFAAGEDFNRYPRTETEDIAALSAQQVALVYIPELEAIYPPGDITRVEVPGLSNILCGAFRPGHFAGVATVVTKLLMQMNPDCGVFGEKDFQQLHIIRQLVRDLCIPVRILGVPTLREADGLAMSSRNRYLSPRERKAAALLPSILQNSVRAIEAGHALEDVIMCTKDALLAQGFAAVDYVSLHDAATLAPLVAPSARSRLLAAVRLGTTRLIDNWEVRS